MRPGGGTLGCEACAGGNQIWPPGARFSRSRPSAQSPGQPRSNDSCHASGRNALISAADGVEQALAPPPAPPPPMWTDEATPLNPPDAGDTTPDPEAPDPAA